MKFFRKTQKEITDYNEIRKQQLELISVELKQARIERNIEKDLISNQLHIPLSILNALESGDLHHLPEPFFTRQLIKKYANFLKLNGEDISQQFSIELNKKVYQKKSSLRSFYFKIPLNFKPQHLYFFYFLLLFFSIRSLSSVLESSQFTQIKIPQKQVIETKIPPTNNTPINTTPEAIPIVEKKEEKPPTPTEIVVKVTVKEDSWVKIIVDEKPVFEGILTKGLEKQWNGKQRVTIRAGNAGGLFVTVNDEKQKELGKSGEVKNITFELPTQS
ncbi:RodZ domain-containing protein [Geminocystis sp. GBBB08]|uniref:helix-turn-helix domain-containing protein n=1 Tax=Geminocystis sp. GBBB08 TaxID=2604140 RepID=UPI0027E36E04|nr:RodZ domain-containing protein [Geminocystis sp. GBBB08]MBL1210644.1 DUF4115 domain-containing protein [Geminocystis sp. GBBB08]